MKSKLYIKEKIENTMRKFGSWKSYYPCQVILDKDENHVLNALFTKHQINTAIKRAIKNKEDIPWTKYFIDKYINN